MREEDKGSMDKAMLAALFEGEGKLALREVPVPKVEKPDDVLLQVEGAGICGTDVHILDVPPGHPATIGAILGHEYVGKVMEIGDDVKGLKPGDRVVVAPNLYCGICHYCQQGRPNQCQSFTTLGVYLNGGFAKYSVAPERALFKISPGLATDEAVFAELLSCVLGGTEKVRLQPGETVAILGAGPVGLVFCLVFKAAGAGKIIVSDIAPFRLAMAKKIGADVVVNPQKEDLNGAVKAATGGGVDVVVDAVGTLLPEAVSLADKGGKVVLFGMNQQAHPAVSQYSITRNELTIYGTFIGINTFPRAIKMLESGAVKPSALITHRLPLSRLVEGLEALRQGLAIKVVLTPE
ncbi:MAG: alcohol dehydrogenase catalytic domain-containing protein [Chloroflexota bacterium]